MSASLAFPDETDWIELPRCTARLYRPGLKPCTECGSTLWSIVLVKRQVKTGQGEPPVWEEDISIECPRCRQESARRSDVRRVIARLDKRRGIVVDLEREHANV